VSHGLGRGQIACSHGLWTSLLDSQNLTAFAVVDQIMLAFFGEFSLPVLTNSFLPETNFSQAHFYDVNYFRKVGVG